MLSHSVEQRGSDGVGDIIAPTDKKDVSILVTAAMAETFTIVAIPAGCDRS